MGNIELKKYKKIMIIGNSSSGKSTLAHQVSEKLGITAHHLDIHYHKPHTQWEAIPKEEFIKKHDKILKNNSWIIEGNYSATIKDRMENSDLIISININRFTSMYNFIYRFFDEHRHGCPEGCESKMELSMIKYILWTYPKKVQKRLELLKKYDKVIYISSFRELIQFKKEQGLETQKKKITKAKN